MKLEILNQERNELVKRYNRWLKKKDQKFKNSKSELMKVNAEIIGEIYRMNKRQSFYELFRSAIELK